MRLIGTITSAIIRQLVKLFPVADRIELKRAAPLHNCALKMSPLQFSLGCCALATTESFWLVVFT